MAGEASSKRGEQRARGAAGEGSSGLREGDRGQGKQRAIGAQGEETSRGHGEQRAMASRGRGEGAQAGMLNQRCSIFFSRLLPKVPHFLQPTYLPPCPSASATTTLLNPCLLTVKQRPAWVQALPRRLLPLVLLHQLRDPSVVMAAACASCCTRHQSLCLV